MTVVLISSDLMLASQVQAAVGREGGSLRQLASMERVPAAADDVSHVIIDLSLPLDPAAAAGPLRDQYPSATLMAVGAHVHTKRLRQAQAAGLRVLTRGQLHAACQSGQLLES